MEKVWRPDGSWQNTVFDSTADKGLLFMLDLYFDVSKAT